MGTMKPHHEKALIYGGVCAYDAAITKNLYEKPDGWYHFVDMGGV